MMLPPRSCIAAVAVGVICGCSAPVLPPPPDGGAPRDAGPLLDAGLPCQGCALNQVCDSAARVCRPSPIRHVVLIVQENHTFDSYFGRWCTAPAGSNPSCTMGRACCEAAPD